MLQRIRTWRLVRKYTTVIDELKERGLISSITDAHVGDHLQKSRKVYLGVDPTADSLHLGHLLPLMVMAHMAIYGHEPILLIGGSTAVIGDPSGREHERALLDLNCISANAENLLRQLKALIICMAEQANFNPDKIHCVNNANWYTSMNVLTFFRDIGNFARISPMLHKEFVKSRLEKGSGISYSEFSYQLFQSYDFYYLYKTYGCTVQIGGHDQWGNLTAGIEYIQRRTRDHSAQVFGITMPLLKDENGMKFGKSAGNPIWLDEEKTSAYQIYQYLMNLPDESMKYYLNMFTLRTKKELEQIMQEHVQKPEKRLAQKLLASDVTKLIHGDEKTSIAINASNALFNDIDLVSTTMNIQGLPQILLKKETFLEMTLADALVYCNLATSKCKYTLVKLLYKIIRFDSIYLADARRLIQSGGCYVNGQRIYEANSKLTEEYLNGSNLCFLKKGKTHQMILCVG
jgi:tyrosyl-tRNA synthetase